MDMLDQPTVVLNLLARCDMIVRITTRSSEDNTVSGIFETNPVTPRYRLTKWMQDIILSAFDHHETITIDYVKEDN
jgi:hypothetical protein